ncbi:MAG: hypothetical protein CMO44_17950 [Verrucomicrobiales bacterium]|nr:hypothetical protein [Verrucomicrobiales bacterium]
MNEKQFNRKLSQLTLFFIFLLFMLISILTGSSIYNVITVDREQTRLKVAQYLVERQHVLNNLEATDGLQNRYQDYMQEKNTKYFSLYNP